MNKRRRSTSIGLLFAEVTLAQNLPRRPQQKNNEESILKALFPQGMLASFPMNQKDHISLDLHMSLNTGCAAASFTS